jgi:hypothetical protein
MAWQMSPNKKRNITMPGCSVAARIAAARGVGAQSFAARRSDGEGGFAVGVVGVEAAMAFGAEQVRLAHALLPQNESQVDITALGASFPHMAKGHQVLGHAIVIEVVDDAFGRQFAQDQRFCVVEAAFRAGVRFFAGHSFENMFTHSNNSS